MDTLLQIKENENSFIVCNFCDKPKHQELFVKDISCVSGYRKRCKDCRNKILREKRALNPSKQYRIKNNTFYANDVTVIRCPKCGDKKPISEYHSHKWSPYGIGTPCKECKRKAEKTQEYRIKSNKLRKERHRNDPYTKMLSWAKYRATQKNLPFSLKEHNIYIPEKCPVSGVKLEIGPENMCNSPVLDRIDNNFGYILDNVWVISHRINRIKRNSDITTLKAVINYIEFFNKFGKSCILPKKRKSVFSLVAGREMFRCVNCDKLKRLGEYQQSCQSIVGIYYVCKECQKTITLEESKKLRREKIEISLQHNCEYHLWGNAKRRAKKRNLEFTIKPSDIIIPEKCPILGIPICVGATNENRMYTPTIDRVDNSKGYTSNNICVVSLQGNYTKADVTLEELKKLVYLLEQFGIDDEWRSSRHKVIKYNLTLEEAEKSVQLYEK